MGPSFEKNFFVLSKECKRQNDIIKLSGDEIKSTILAEATSAKWFSVMADECTDESTIEQMSICIRYIQALMVLLKLGKNS